MGKIKDLIGMKFGKLTVVKFAGLKNNRTATWECLCECGNSSIVIGGNLTVGTTKSCGCIQLRNSHKHGETKNGGTTEYRSWTKMKARCLNPNVRDYHHYGGRGITICDRWLNSYEAFLEDMGRAPSPQHSIDRKNVNGNYEKDNCRWATDEEQANNTTRNIYITYLGKTQSISLWAKELNIDANMIYKRIDRYGWDPISAITLPKHSKMPIFKNKLTN